MLPLPKGEGRGEGKGSIQFPHDAIIFERPPCMAIFICPIEVNDQRPISSIALRQYHLTALDIAGWSASSSLAEHQRMS